MSGRGARNGFLCLSFRAKGALHFVPTGQRLNSESYWDIVTTESAPGCHMQYGIPPDCFPQQDGAADHTSGLVLRYSRWEFPMFWDKKSRPPNSPSLNVPDYCSRGHPEGSSETESDTPRQFEVGHSEDLVEHAARNAPAIRRGVAEEGKNVHIGGMVDIEAPYVRRRPTGISSTRGPRGSRRRRC